MKKIILSIFVLLLIAATATYADPFKVSKPVVCYESSTIYEQLINGEFAELPIWGGNGEQSNFVLLVNNNTKTWTLVEFNKDTSCIIGFGEGFQFLKSNNLKNSI